jgi:hypothetical protein
MTLAKVIEKNIIEFEKPINLQKVEDLLYEITDKLLGEAKVSYTDSCERVIYRQFYDKNHPEKGRNTKIYFVDSSINGVITSQTARSSFEFIHSIEGPYYLGAIKLYKTPGDALNEDDPNMIKLWEDIRKIVSGYIKTMP